MPIASGRRTVRLTIDDPLPRHDGTAPTQFSPSVVYGAVQPAAPGPADENGPVAVLVTIPFHRQITTNHRLQYSRHGVDHQLWVRGVQNPDLADRDLVLYCEEVLTP